MSQQTYQEMVDALKAENDAKQTLGQRLAKARVLVAEMAEDLKETPIPIDAGRFEGLILAKFVEGGIIAQDLTVRMREFESAGTNVSPTVVGKESVNAYYVVAMVEGDSLAVYAWPNRVLMRA